MNPEDIEKHNAETLDRIFSKIGRKDTTSPSKNPTSPDTGERRRPDGSVVIYQRWRYAKEGDKGSYY